MLMDLTRPLSNPTLSEVAVAGVNGPRVTSARYVRDTLATFLNEPPRKIDEPLSTRSKTVASGLGAHDAPTVSLPSVLITAAFVRG
jgi:hypothetical protein